MTGNVFLDTFSTVYEIMTIRSNVFSYIGVTLVAPLAISLCFIIYISMTGYNFWRHGREKAWEISKDYLRKFAIIIVLVVPVQGTSGAYHNLLTLWPWMVAKSAVIIGDDIAMHLPVYDPTVDPDSIYSLDDLEKDIGMNCDDFEALMSSSSPPLTMALSQAMVLQEDVASEMRSRGIPTGILGVTFGSSSLVSAISDQASKTNQWIAKCENSLIDKKVSLGVWGWLKAVVLTVIVVVGLIVLLGAITLMSGGVSLSIVGILVAGVKSLVAGGVFALLGLQFSAMMLAVALSAKLFIMLINLAFISVILVWLIKIFIYAITFPIAVINFVFKQQENVFIRYFVKGLSLILMPAIAVCIYSSALVIFAVITADNGFLSVLRNSFLGSSAGADLGIFIKMLVWVVVAPFVLALPIAKVMLSASSVVEEITQVRAGYAIGSIQDKISRLM